MTKKMKAIQNRLERATKVMHGDAIFVNTAWFIETSLDFLASHFGDVHLEYMSGDYWGCSSCRAGDGWDNWETGETPEDALAKAVIAAGRILKGKP